MVHGSRIVLTSLIVAATAALGCTAQRLAEDQQQLRVQVLTLMEDQVLDNLARLQNGEMVVHLQYYDFGGKSNTELSSEGSITDNDDATANGGTVVALDKGTSGVKASGKIFSELTMKATPSHGPAAAAARAAYEKFFADTKPAAPQAASAGWGFSEQCPRDAFKRKVVRRWHKDAPSRWQEEWFFIKPEGVKAFKTLTETIASLQVEPAGTNPKRDPAPPRFQYKVEVTKN